MNEEFTVKITSISRGAYNAPSGIRLHHKPYEWLRWKSVQKGGSHVKHRTALKDVAGVYEVAMAYKSPDEDPNYQLLYVGSSGDLANRLEKLVHLGEHEAPLRIFPHVEELLFNDRKKNLQSKNMAELKEKFNDLPPHEREALLAVLWVRWARCPTDFVLLEYVLHLYGRPKFRDKDLFPDG